MITNRKSIFIFALIGLMLLLTACGGGDAKVDTTGGNGAAEVDYDATSAALAATADAIAGAGQQEPTAPPPPSGDSAPADPPSSGSSGDDSVIWYTEFDSFEEEEDVWDVFTIGGSDNYSALVNTGYLTTILDAPNETLYLMNDYIYMERGNADVLVEVGFDNVGDVRTNNISVICRASEKGWYEFSLGSDGLWAIWKYTAGSGYDQLANGGIAGYDWKVTDHTLRAGCIGDYLAFAIDGDIPKYAEINDRSFREGGIGFSISTFSQGGVEVEFDYFFAEYADE